MIGSSREAWARAHDTFVQVVGSEIDAMALASDLFGMSSALDSSAGLRRALVDPARDAASKTRLVTRLFDGKVSDGALIVLSSLSAGRWATDRDFTDTVESFAVEAVVRAAQSAGRLDDLEDELFRFGRVVDGNTALRAAITDPSRSGKDKAALVDDLLGTKVGPETRLLARQSVLAPRGRRFDRVVEAYGAIAARRRDELTAMVTTAVALDPAQRERLARALGEIYGRAVQLNVAMDPGVLGGIRIQVGDEVVDGTILRRLETARRRLAG
jgi:F-type H+-transporting ATPase subunit delta